MKIAIITNLYQPFSRGGAEIVVKNIASGLKKKGHEVIVITTHPKAKLDIKDENGIKVYRFKPLNIFYYLDDYLYPYFIRLIWRVLDIFNIGSYITIKSILKQEKPDLVLTHNLVGIGFLIPKLIKSLKIKHIHTLHDVQLAEPSGLALYELLYSESFLKKCYIYISKNLFKSIDSVISPSGFLLDYYAHYGFFSNSKKYILQNPAIIYQDIELNFHEENDDDKNFHYVFAGQIEDHKGIRFLIKAFKKIDNSNITLSVVGSGTILEEIMSLSENDPRIKILGRLDNFEVIDLIKKAHYVIVPSMCYENSPTIIYESFSQCKPVIASNIGGIPELVTDKRGFLFDPGDEDSFFKALEKSMLLDNEDYTKMCYEGKIFIDTLSLNNYVNNLQDIILNIK